MIKLRKVTKNYNIGDKHNQVVKGITLHIRKGEFAILIGESGAGKSTLLNIMCALEKVDSGIVKISGMDINKFNDVQLSSFRKLELGFIFQFYNLISNLTVEENIELVARMTKDSYSVKEVMKRTGLDKLSNSFPHQLSGGEQQRVAIARAIIKKPKILLCDEPTGALDNKTGREILILIQEIAKEEGMTVVMVTHNRNLLSMADKIYEISDGLIINRFKNNQPVSVFLADK